MSDNPLDYRLFHVSFTWTSHAEVFVPHDEDPADEAYEWAYEAHDWADLDVDVDYEIGPLEEGVGNLRPLGGRGKFTAAEWAEAYECADRDENGPIYVDRWTLDLFEWAKEQKKD